MDNPAIKVGSVPTGSRCIRKAEAADLRIDPSRVALFEYPDGSLVWLSTEPAAIAKPFR